MDRRSIFSAVLMSAMLLLAFVFGVRSSMASEGDGKTYTIEYVLDGGYADGNPTSYVSGAIEGGIPLQNPTKDGSTFSGWVGQLKNDDGTRTALGNIPDRMNVTISQGQTGDLLFTALWDGAAPESVLGADSAPEADAQAGGEGGVPVSGAEEASQTHDGTVTGRVQSAVYNITYNLGGGIVNNDATYNSAVGYTLQNPKKEGYEFYGWIGVYTATGRSVPFISDMMNVRIPVGTEGDLSFTALYTSSDGTSIVVPDVEVDMDENGLKSKGAFAYYGGEGGDIYLDSDDIKTLQGKIDTLTSIVEQNKANSDRNVSSLGGVRYEFKYDTSAKEGTIMFQPDQNHP